MERRELLYCLGEGVGSWVRCQGMRLEERKAKAEVGRGEDGQGFDENVGDGLIADEVRVELISEARTLLLVSRLVVLRRIFRVG